MTNRWSDDDIQFLSENAGIKNHEELSKELNRTVRAIRIKQVQLNIRFLDNIYTYTTLSNELGVHRKTIRIWFNKGLIKGRKANWTTYYGQRPMIFLEEDIIKFLKKYCGMIDEKRINNVFFKNVVIKAKNKLIVSVRKREKNAEKGRIIENALA